VRRSAKKKTVKKKTATKTAPKSKTAARKTVSATNEFDSWAEKQKKRGGCQTCRHEGVNDTIRALLESVIRKRAYKFSIHELRGIVNAKHPESDVGQRGLERHLRSCERALYFRARGRRDV